MKMMMISSSTTKMVSMATRDYFYFLSSITTTTTTTTTSSLTHFRPLTCAATPTSSSSSPAPRLVPHPPDLINWVRREGGFVHQAVKISQVDLYGLGLVASEEIPKGSDLIALPDHIPLQFGSLELDGGDAAHSVLVNLARQVPEELWAMRLGLKLLQERAKSGSFWWPYISNLPETYSIPIFFPREDIKNLQYAPLLYQVNKRCRFLLEFEKEIKQALENLKPEDHPFGGQDVDSSSLGWAMSAVSSRAFRLYGKELPGGTHINVPMMLPLIDMCNHSFSPNAKIVQERNTGNPKMLVKVVAGTQIKQDEPLVLNYGCLNNDFFLLDYGFVVPSNPYDCIELKYDGALLDAASMAAGVSSPNFSSPAPWQQQILSQLNLDGEAPLLKVSIGGPELVEDRLLAALRVLLADDMEMVKHDLSTLKSLSVEAPLGISNEVSALRTVIALCVIALGHFPTKIMEDESILKQRVSVSTELAVQFRIQKKSTIIDVMRDLTRRVKLLLSKESVSA
ncbi:actin-histidine N-methyltransferase [Camellia sinensis]|uniref:actin-histidine N-methyltransferase n=1 Tax=Camellia sinensis TaxID=4442 RepID=UPI0010356825|nr:actin-histidine N-methyltransferase [Camellia sinensis]